MHDFPNHAENQRKSVVLTFSIRLCLCIIKIFRGGQGWWHLQNPLPPMNNFCLYPSPVLRCFWKDPLMTPTPTTPLQKHPLLLPPSLSATPPPPLKMLIIHFSINKVITLAWVFSQCLIHLLNNQRINSHGQLNVLPAFFINIIWKTFGKNFLRQNIFKI